jgi:hypothetical protein
MSQLLHHPRAAGAVSSVTGNACYATTDSTSDAHPSFLTSHHFSIQHHARAVHIMSRPLYFLHSCLATRDALRCGNFPCLTSEFVPSRHCHSLAALALTNFDQASFPAAFLSCCACNTFARSSPPPSTNTAQQAHVVSEAPAQLVHSLEHLHSTHYAYSESHVRRHGPVRVRPSPARRCR